MCSSAAILDPATGATTNTFRRVTTTTASTLVVMATGEADIAIGDGIIGSLAGRRNQVVKVVEVAVEAVGVVQSAAASATRKESPQGRQRFVVMGRKDVRSGAVVGSGRRVIVLVTVVRTVMTTATAKGGMIQRVVAATGTTSSSTG